MSFYQNYSLFTNVGHKSKRKTRFKSLMTKSGPIGQISCYAKIVLCVRIMGLYILQACQDTQISFKNRTEAQIIVEVRTYYVLYKFTCTKTELDEDSLYKAYDKNKIIYRMRFHLSHHCNLFLHCRRGHARCNCHLHRPRNLLGIMVRQ